MPPASTRAAAASISCWVRGCSSPVTLCTNSGIGTPQVRWREMHQSGRLSIMPVMRGSPQAGVHCTPLMSRSVCVAQLRLLHADEPLRRGAEDHRALVAPAHRVAVPEGSSCSSSPALAHRLDDDRVGGIDLQARDQRRAGRKRPSLPTGFEHLEAVALPDRKILLAVPGAVCTAPVPASSVTCSPRITGTRAAGTGAAASGPPVRCPRSAPAPSRAQPVALRGTRP